MGKPQSVEVALDLSGAIAEGQRREDGYWANVQGEPLPVSASDLERHTYCPVSWQLSKAGISGEGEALQKGMREHDRIHKKMVDYKHSEAKASQELVIWTWWITVVCALSADSAAFFFVNEGAIPEEFWLLFGCCWQSFSFLCHGADGWVGPLAWHNLPKLKAVGWRDLTKVQSLETWMQAELVKGA
jgi:hypothetical protein